MARNREMDNLAKDAAAALAAGMSYGKYMAAHYKPVEKKPAQKKPEGDKVCKICGAPFYAVRPHQICCGTACSLINARRKSAEWHRKNKQRGGENDGKNIPQTN